MATLEATTGALISMIPVVAATGVVVSLTKSTLAERDEDGKRVREGKYIVKVSKGSDTKYVGPFKTKAQADQYARKVKAQYPAYKVSVVR